MSNSVDMNKGLREYIEELKDEFCKMTDSNYCMLKTGELFTEAEVNAYMVRKIEGYNVERNAQLLLTARESGIEVEQRLLNKKSKKKKSGKGKNRYDRGDFNMLYREEMENFMALKLTLIEEGVFSRLCKFLQYPTNCVIINGSVPSFEVLCKIMGLKDRALRGHIKTLEQKGVIKLVQHGHKKAIYVNPQYCSTGKDLDIDTLRLFNLIECDYEKVDSYL